MPAAEETAIREVLERYIEGLRTADVALLKSAFHPQASFYGPFGDTFLDAPIAGLFDWASSELTPGATGSDHRLEVDEIEVADRVAVVKCRELDFFGGNAKEFFTLAKSEDSWMITSKSWADA